MEMNKSVNIYGCGGFGINIVNLLNDQPKTGARFNSYLIDTSTSNLRIGQSQENFYGIPGCDGSGKNPALNYQAIQKYIPNVLDKFPASEINLVVASLSGGSGNVITAELADNLWRDDKEVIFYLIGSREDLTATNNTRNLLASLRNKGRAAGKCPVIYYDDNLDATQDDIVDKDMVTSIAAFLELYSGNHSRLDSTDIRNWMNPKVESQILLLDIAVTYERAVEVESPLSVATVYDSEQMRTKAIPAMRTCEGIRNNPCGHNLYLIISGSGLDRIVDGLSSTITDYKQKLANANNAAGHKGLDKLAAKTASGMVFDD